MLSPVGPFSFWPTMRFMEGNYTYDKGWCASRIERKRFWLMKTLLIGLFTIGIVLATPAGPLHASEQGNSPHDEVVQDFVVGESFLRLSYVNGLILHIRKDMIIGLSIFGTREGDERRSVRAVMIRSNLIPVTTYVGSDQVLSYRHQTTNFRFESMEMALEFSDWLMGEELQPVQLPSPY